MSDDVHYKGKLKRLAVEGHEEIETYAKTYVEEQGDELKSYCDDYTEHLRYEYNDKFVVIDDILWEVITKEEQDAYGSVFNLRHSKDDEYTYEVKYYNGGCGFEEALQEAFDEMPN